ncbi:MAG: YqiA/YcfP family alpha/beta fold hydrolase [Myxococcaceae bacterium]
MVTTLGNASPRWLYAHGFASGPGSMKGVALAKHYAARSVHLERLDLRLPSFEHLRLSAILEAMRLAIGSEADRAVVFGSSLGGLAAARLAESDPRVRALVLLAPGFRIAEQLAKRVGEADMRRWRDTGWMETYDHAQQRQARVDYGFYEDAAVLDARNGGWPHVRVPTLVIHGVNDDTCSIDVTRTWARERRNVHLVEVDDGHELKDSLPLIQREADRFLAAFLD